MNDEQAAQRGGHPTLKGALGAYRRRQEAGDRLLARHGLPTATTPPRDPAPRPPPDYGGGATRGRTPANPPPSMSDVLRALSRREL